MLNNRKLLLSDYKFQCQVEFTPSVRKWCIHLRLNFVRKWCIHLCILHWPCTISCILRFEGADLECFSKNDYSATWLWIFVQFLPFVHDIFVNMSWKFQIDQTGDSREPVFWKSVHYSWVLHLLLRGPFFSPIPPLSPVIVSLCTLLNALIPGISSLHRGLFFEFFANVYIIFGQREYFFLLYSIVRGKS